ncbi:ATP-dependent nuclease [Streptococcus rifensis]
MYLKSIRIENFRKFRSSNNIISFVPAVDLEKNNTKIQSSAQENKLIDIASKTTLIVGKNNSGKTTIVTALKKLIRGEQFFSNDFNNAYLQFLVKDYRKYLQKIGGDRSTFIYPVIEFELTIGLDDSENNNLALLRRFISNKNIENQVEIIAKIELKEMLQFKELIEKTPSESISVDFIKEKLNQALVINYYCKIDNELERVTQFNLSQLFEITSISANNIKSEDGLTKAFSKIIQYAYKNKLSTLPPEYKLDKFIDDTNNQLSENIDLNYTQTFMKHVAKVLPKQSHSIKLSSKLTIDKLLSVAIQYEYSEDAMSVPENQYGLGYTNLMVIISEIIQYIEKDIDSSFTSQINIISIEEPETYMHPQMQEQFIKNLESLINSILSENKKEINCQIVVTTHSSHILNSKVHQGKKFDDINYVREGEQGAEIITITNHSIAGGSRDENNDFKFLKKHFKYGISEIFFADGVIFVEGITEYRLFQYLLDNDERLNGYFISLVLVNGAHGKVYLPLVKLLEIPCLIITDIDYKRTDEEKKGFVQISDQNKYIIANYEVYFKQVKDKVLNILEPIAKEKRKFTHVKNLVKSIEFNEKIGGFFPENYLDYIKQSIVRDSVIHKVPKICRAVNNIAIDQVMPIDIKRVSKNTTISHLIGGSTIEYIFKAQKKSSYFDDFKEFLKSYFETCDSKINNKELIDEIITIQISDAMRSLSPFYFYYYVKNAVKFPKEINELKNSNQFQNSIFSGKYGNSLKKPITIHPDIILSFQDSSIQGFYPTSFEEAYILSNIDNAMLQDILIEMKIISEKNDINPSFSFAYQEKIAANNKKSEFANELLYKILLEDDNNKHPKLPDYLEQGIIALSSILGGK